MGYSISGQIQICQCWLYYIVIICILLIVPIYCLKIGHPQFEWIVWIVNDYHHFLYQNGYLEDIVHPISKQPYCPDHAMGPMDVAMMRRCFFDVAYRLAPTGAGVLRGLIVTGAGSRGHVGLGLRRVTGDWDGGSSLKFGQVRNFRLSSAEFEEWNKEKTKLIGFSSKWRIFSPIERAFCQ